MSFIIVLESLTLFQRTQSNCTFNVVCDFEVQNTFKQSWSILICSRLKILPFPPPFPGPSAILYIPVEANCRLQLLVTCLSVIFSFFSYLFTAICRIPCRNDGLCVAPEFCSCKPNYFGRYCQFISAPNDDSTHLSKGGAMSPTLSSSPVSRADTGEDEDSDIGNPSAALSGESNLGQPHPDLYR